WWPGSTARRSSGVGPPRQRRQADRPVCSASVKGQIRGSLIDRRASTLVFALLDPRRVVPAAILGAVPARAPLPGRLTHGCGSGILVRALPSTERRSQQTAKK